jgi:high-affinity iron transporter
MFASLLIVFREVLEAGLIVGIVLAATEGIANRAAWIATGIGAGVAGAAILASFAGALSNAFSGSGQEVFTASVLIVAVIMLGWHNLWMASRGREIVRQMSDFGRDVAAGRRSLPALALVVTIAVLREGSEIVLFLYGIATSAQTGLVAMLFGGAGGIALGVALSWLIYAGLVLIPLRRLFTVTGVLISVLAAGMAGQAAAILAEANFIPAWGWQIWDSSWLISSGSLAGRALQALTGYSDRPVGIQLATWLATLIVLLTASRLLNQRSAPPASAPIAHN